MPKVDANDIDEYELFKEIVPRRKKEKFEEFRRGHNKLNKRNKKCPANDR
tara:strand:+ start:2477 stop:2626 length:150 start_codon:yes stop_codon:yes gene_type:complete